MITTAESDRMVRSRHFHVPLADYIERRRRNQQHSENQTKESALQNSPSRLREGWEGIERIAELFSQNKTKGEIK